MLHSCAAKCVAVIDPIKRGLKGSVNVLALRQIVPVAVIDPIKRGLKGSCGALNEMPVEVAVIDPIKRGLKVQVIIGIPGHLLRCSH